MRLATSDASTYPKDDTARIAYELLKEGFGAGFNAPLLLAVELPKDGDQAALTQIGDALKAQDGHRVGPAAAAQQGRRHGDDDRLPDDDAAGRDDRRDGEDGAQRHAAADRRGRPAHASRSAARRRRTSTSRRRSGTSSRCSSASSSGLSLLLLGVVFRSILIPIKAGIFNLLSITGAFGVDHADLPGRQPGLPVRRRHRTDRVLPPDHDLRGRVRVVDGLRGVPRVPHARGVGARRRTRATRCATGSP